MKQFVLLTIGYTTPTKEIMQEWMKWFDSIDDRIIDQVGLRNGREITDHDVMELPMDANAITGYLVINAENMEEAVNIAKQCPMITSTHVYELKRHG